MENEKALMALLSRLEKLNRIIIIKDFVGFLSWNTSLGGILVPHVGHHCAFCTAMKQNEQAYACCVTCSKVHQWLCQRKGEPFIRDCQFGLSEYSVPILLDDICIGSLSVGMYCQDTQESDEKTLRIGNTSFRQMPRRAYRSVFSKSAAPCLHQGQIKSSGRSSPS